ncbi:MAG: hypothetical protein QW175_02800 [Candidatus Bathyarchaeia archaeon]
MVVSGELRYRKYQAKFDPAVVSARYTAVKEIANEQQAARQAELADLMNDVRGILNSYGVSSLMTVLYTSFANKIYGINRRFTDPVRQTEAHAAAQLWVSRGANREILNNILGLFGISPLP